MHRLFVGNVPMFCTPQELKNIFHRCRIEVIDVKLRSGGYAFVDVPNQNAADRAIELFKGKCFLSNGSLILVKSYLCFGLASEHLPNHLRVEPSMPKHVTFK